MPESKNRAKNRAAILYQLTIFCEVKYEMEMRKSSISEKIFVREARLELAYPSGRHPLKMVCLPVPPLAHSQVKSQN